jgi:hypothetical protein
MYLFKMEGIRVETIFIISQQFVVQRLLLRCNIMLDSIFYLL